MALRYLRPYIAVGSRLNISVSKGQRAVMGSLGVLEQMSDVLGVKWGTVRRCCGLAWITLSI